jgi:hypothetical protein
MDLTHTNALIKEAAVTPLLMNYVATHFSGDDGFLLDLLLSDAEESPYPLQQWLEALLFVDQWLVQCGLSLPLENQIGYVACSAEAGSAYATLTQLSVQVAEMLETYGCDAARPK